MTARLVDGPIRERKTVVARFGAPEIMHTTIHGRVHLGVAAISRESNYEILFTSVLGIIS